MYLTGAVHLGFAIVALGSGLAVLLMSKGTRLHRKVGWVYLISMLGLNGTALAIYRLTGTFGPFHIAAVVSLVSVIAGVIPVRRRRPRKTWIDHHAYWITWSYVGLVAAAVSEVTTRVPSSPFWWMVFGSTLLVIGIGRQLITKRVPVALRAFRGQDP